MRGTKWFGLYRWDSICPRPQDLVVMGGSPDPTCSACRSGWWSFLPIETPKRAIGSFIFKRWPDLWRWWANRPNSQVRRRLESIFPGLRSK